MRRWLILMWSACLFMACQSPQPSPRLNIPFNDGWRFKLAGSDWRLLNLPHDWSIEGKFSAKNPAGYGGGALPGGIGWYQKSFKWDDKWTDKQVYIAFEGVYRNSEVWLNGHLLGKRPNGYISFRYDLSPYLYTGKTNVLVVRVDNSHQPNSRWYSGSGIYRPVHLLVTNKLAIGEWGTFVATPRVSAHLANVVLATTLHNTSSLQKDIRVETVIQDTAGKEVGTGSQSVARLVKGADTVLTATFNVKDPLLWSLKTPVMYKAVTRVYNEGTLVDAYETPFGIRSIRFDADSGFYLNGQYLKIRGVCLHHDLGALGAAFNLRAAERQLEVMKAMGVNAIRTSHNPPAPGLLDLCDRMGILVMDEAFDMWAKEKTAYDYHLDWSAWHRRDLEDQVKRDRNHPSVIIWSVGNEIKEQWPANASDTSGKNIARELAAIVRHLDKNRPITTANNEIGPHNPLIQSGAFDLIGYNYNHEKWASFHTDYPGKKLIVTESTSALSSRGYYDIQVSPDSMRHWPKRWDISLADGSPGQAVSSYDHIHTPWGSSHEESLQALEQNSVVSGMFVWTGFDYLGEPTPYEWPSRSSYFGLVDLAGFPKDSYYLYQSVWTDKPMLHILPHWNWKKRNIVPVVAYYNQADEAELYLNGRSLGKRRKEQGKWHVRWQVSYEPGVLKAVTRKNGKIVQTQEIYTAGEPYRIALTADRTQLHKGAQDLAYVTIQLVDKVGHAVPLASQSVNINVIGDGQLAATDNGDPTSHASFQSPAIKTYYGKAIAIIRSGFHAGKIRVKASSSGLIAAQQEISVQ
ncbi:beta-galactosidase [bacterium A37T11]|nr:beta-galactosidase [bacterium A37T11]